MGKRSRCYRRHRKNADTNALIDAGGTLPVEIIAGPMTQAEAWVLEIELISKHMRGCDGGIILNISTGGADGGRGVNPSPEHRAAISAAKKGRPATEAQLAAFAACPARCHCQNSRRKEGAPTQRQTPRCDLRCFTRQIVAGGTIRRRGQGPSKSTGRLKNSSPTPCSRVISFARESVRLFSLRRTRPSGSSATSRRLVHTVAGRSTFQLQIKIGFTMA
jgi:hypothetical protein